MSNTLQESFRDLSDRMAALEKKLDTVIRHLKVLPAELETGEIHPFETVPASQDFLSHPHYPGLG